MSLTGASSGLLVDETFGDNGSHDGHDVGKATATLDASKLFAVDGGADGVADMSYSLTVSQQPNDLTAIVDGQEYNVTFVVINGQVRAMAGNTGKDIFTVSINEETGEVTLQLTGNGSLKHPNSNNDDEILNNIIDDINVKLTVTDGDGDVTSSEAKLEIQVTDDGPIASADQVVLTEAAAQAGGSGANVLNNDVFGADAPENTTVSSVNGGTPGQPVDGQYGKLTLNADGSYTYTLNAGVDVPKGETYTEEFTYTITDKDGDTSEATLTIHVTGDENEPVVTVDTPEPGDANIMVDEGALQAGSGQHTEHGVSGTGSFTVQLNGEDGVITVGGENGWKVTVTGENADVTGSVVKVNGVAVTVTGATKGENGTWTVNYRYELTGDQQHGTPADGNYHTDELTGSIAISVTDATGDTGSGTLTVEVHDDGPVAVADDVTLTEAAAQAGGSGANVLNNDVFGADAPENTTVSSVNGGTPGQPVDGQYGKLTLNADGSYTYTLNAGVDVPKGETYTEEFTYTITDKDGDTSEATLTIHVTGDENEPVVTVDTPEPGDANIMVDEGALQAGSGQHTEHGVSGTGSFTVQLNGEDGVITVGGESGWTVTVTGDSANVTGSVVTVNGVAVTVTGATQAADGTWTVNYGYELTRPQTHGPDGSATDASLTGEIAISVTDATGDTAEGKLTVEVHDDVPTITASDMSTSVVPGSGAGNLENGEAADFTQGTGNLGASSELAGWDGVTMYAAKVTYSGSGNDVQISDIDGNGSYNLKYSPYKGLGNSESDWGLTVDAGEHNEEISVIKDEHGNANQSEAVVFDLGGQLAYGVTINFGAFYNGKPGAEGTTQWDHVSEKALVTFYRDGQIVGSTLVEGQSSSGTFTLNASDVVLGGFDQVVISAVDNRTPQFQDENSDFTIQGIDFITKRDAPIIVSEGTVTADSGADDFAAAYADSHVRFDLAGMVKEGTLSDDGNSGDITVLMGGQEQKVTLTLSEGPSGDSILTGTLADGEQLFTATLDKDGNWTMEQYEQFQVQTDAGASNQFELAFKTEDADGDVVSTTVDVPLEVVDQTPGLDSPIDNGNDRITIAGGDGVAGTVAAGDSGGVEVQTTVQPGESYNISIMLDLSGSMTDRLHSGTRTTRIEMAVDALKKFFETSLQNHDGDICLQLVGFGTNEMGTRTWTIAGDATVAEKQQVYNEFAAQLNTWRDAMDGWGYSQGTNYEAAMEKATEWFSKSTEEGGVAGNDGENLAFFISDGEPTYSNDNGSGSSTPSNVVEDTLHAAQNLQNAGGGVHVNAIGIGESDSLSEGGQKILDLIDNTGGSGQTVTKYPYQYNAGSDWWPQYEWTTGDWTEGQELVLGDSDLVNSENDLTAALVGGSEITSTELADAGSDEITAADSASSVIVYGDVQNTDRLLYDLNQNTTIQAALVAAGIGYGSGAEVFQWLEENADSAILKGTEYEGWTHTDTVDYMLEHAEELGYETLVSDDGTFYLADAHGDVLSMDGSEAGGVELAGLTGRDGGNDTITGSSADDFIFGQEGNDTIHGGAGDDVIYGGSGDDTIDGGAGNDYIDGGAGNDYIDGGAGADTIYGGEGNDIIVYDASDVLVDGGEGIDFMVFTDSNLTLDALLAGGDGKPTVEGIEVLITGSDALSLTSMEKLAANYGISISVDASGNETLTLDMTKWTEQPDGTYDFKGEADLTLQLDSSALQDVTPDDAAAQQQVFQLQNSNG